jgi:hypothetical protein
MVAFTVCSACWKNMRLLVSYIRLPMACGRAVMAMTRAEKERRSRESECMIGLFSDRYTVHSDAFIVALNGSVPDRPFHQRTTRTVKSHSGKRYTICLW